MQIVAHKFRTRDLVAAHPALDFVNTVTARDTPVPLDWLDSYSRLLDWAALADVVDAASLERLRKLAAASPRSAGAALARARRVREALHRTFEALIQGKPPPAAHLERIGAAWKKALGRTQLVYGGERVEATLDVRQSGLELVADELVLRAIDLLRDFPKERARVCLGTQCGWLFIDTSKAGRRVWCDMATCGNAAKSRRHYRRRRKSVSPLS
jgi:predicted RNA-binding Zn ribbon-like protein